MHVLQTLPEIGRPRSFQPTTTTSGSTLTSQPKWICGLTAHGPSALAQRDAVNSKLFHCEFQMDCNRFAPVSLYTDTHAGGHLANMRTLCSFARAALRYMERPDSLRRSFFEPMAVYDSPEPLQNLDRYVL